MSQQCCNSPSREMIPFLNILLSLLAISTSKVGTCILVLYMYAGMADPLLAGFPSHTFASQSWLKNGQN
jgi:hypothetical protein